MDKRHVNPSELEIGDYVNYKPTNGTYKVESIYTGLKSGNDQTFSTESDLKWRVWSVDNNNLCLISDKVTTQKLKLQSWRGYNNGVTLLDNICDRCYKNSSYAGIKTQSLRVEDIAKVKNYFGTPSGETNHNYTFSPPVIWVKYESNSKDDAINNRSIAYELTSEMGYSARDGSPYHTVSYTTDIFNSLKNPNYTQLLQAGTTNPYWIATRGVDSSNESWCLWGLHVIDRTTLHLEILLEARSGGRMDENPSENNFRPMVNIPISSFELTTSNTVGMDYDITAK